MRLGLVTLIVPSYDAGLTFFVDGLGWHLSADEDQGAKRWVVVAPPAEGTTAADRSSEGAALLLAVATSATQETARGAQAGDRVAFFLYTDAFHREADRITAAGGTLIEPPRTEPYGTVAQWRDPWGNLWDLIQPA